MAEFTGERVVPGKVDPDLWNEHRSRYLFAARLCRRKRVLDVGCGTGYGTAEIARVAASVIGLDVAADGLDYARAHFRSPNMSWVGAQAGALPFPEKGFDSVIAFEIVEHLTEWQPLFDEAARVLSDSGQFIVSTPNKKFYAEARRLSGPNPFHQHEFEYEEFRAALQERFANVSLFLQNHGPSITFQPVEESSGAEVRVETEGVDPETSNFFVAVCAAARQTGAPTFVHVPSSANVLRERDQHIQLLEGELRTKDEWLDQSRQEHQKLVEEFRALKEELEERNRWADDLNAELAEARQDIDRLNGELAERAASYEAKIAELDREKSELASDHELKLKELAECVQLLHDKEATIEERTNWALKLDQELRDLEARMGRVEASRWVKLGRKIGVGPDLLQE